MQREMQRGCWRQLHVQRHWLQHWRWLSCWRLRWVAHVQQGLCKPKVQGMLAETTQPWADRPRPVCRLGGGSTNRKHPAEQQPASEDLYLSFRACRLPPAARHQRAVLGQVEQLLSLARSANGLVTLSQLPWLLRINPSFQ
jgi:hypothetical protein